MSNSIFRITQDLLDIERELEENGGELTEELEQKLAINSENFKVKVRDYTAVINSLTADVNAIDTELIRLTALKKSKKSSIDRLTNILLWAIEQFGDTTPKGIKYVDWGTGKVQIRRSQKVEVDDNNANYIGEQFMKDILYNQYCNTLDQASGVDLTSFVDEINATKDEDGNEHKITEDELHNISVNFDIDVPLARLASGDEFNWLKKLIATFTTYKTTTKVSKSDVKDVLKQHPDATPNIAKLVENKTLTIK